MYVFNDRNKLQNDINVFLDTLTYHILYSFASNNTIICAEFTSFCKENSLVAKQDFSVVKSKRFALLLDVHKLHETMAPSGREMRISKLKHWSQP